MCTLYLALNYTLTATTMENKIKSNNNERRNGKTYNTKF